MAEQKPTKEQPTVKEKLRRAGAEIRDLIDEQLNKGLALVKDWRKFKDIIKNNYELGLYHLQRGNTNDAILRFKFVVWMEPAHADAWYYLGRSFLLDGNRTAAKNAFAKSLKLDPGNEEAQYLFAIAGGKIKAPERIPPKLAEQHFNTLALDFSKEQEALEYKGHILLADAIMAALVRERANYSALELGVGSGLCGSRLRGVCEKLTGVDISQGMIDEATKLTDAQGRKIYDSLMRADLLEYLKTASSDAYDIIFASGVFGYVGKLDDILKEAVRVLKPGGLLAFTVDRGDGDGYVFEAMQGRFLFSKIYIQKLAAANQLIELKLEDVFDYPEHHALLALYKK